MSWLAPVEPVGGTNVAGPLAHSKHSPCLKLIAHQGYKTSGNRDCLILLAEGRDGVRYTTQYILASVPFRAFCSNIIHVFSNNNNSKLLICRGWVGNN